MYLRLLIILIVSICLASCGNDKKRNLPTIEQLQDGRYVVIGAKRNGTPTGTLNSGFYEIRNDSSFTNLTKTHDSIGTTYVFENNKITHKNPNALNFIVSKMTSDSLELNTKLRDYDFELYLVKDSYLEDQE